jgi:hypothetical protein
MCAWPKCRIIKLRVYQTPLKACVAKFLIDYRGCHKQGIPIYNTAELNLNQKLLF